MSNEYKSVISDKKNEANSLMTSEQITACNLAIHTASVAAGAAGVIPIPVADAVPISAAQVTMAVALGKIFDQKLTDSAAKALISAAASTFAGRTLVKIIPIVGWVVSAAVAAGVTEAIGWTLAVDFAKAYRAAQKGCSEQEDAGTESEETFEDNTNQDKEEQSDSENDKKTDDCESNDDESLSKDFENMFNEEDN